MIMTTEQETDSNGAGQGSTRTVSFTARDITGLHEITVDDMPAAAPVGDVARSLANRLNLPANVSWSLRNDRTGDYLRDDADLGGEVPEKGAKLTITPRTHLG